MKMHFVAFLLFALTFLACEEDKKVWEDKLFDTEFLSFSNRWNDTTELVYANFDSTIFDTLRFVELLERFATLNRDGIGRIYVNDIVWNSSLRGEVVWRGVAQEVITPYTLVLERIGGTENALFFTHQPENTSAKGLLYEELIPQLNLNDRRFSSVKSFKNQNLVQDVQQVYYSQSAGIIRIQRNNETWTLFEKEHTADHE